ncbi:MAG TPA: SDR family oxidoreductase [Acidimicrobiia bacterium]|nr:SDR family oxidoreductase [Acidimicrobiia bacterium]
MKAVVIGASSGLGRCIGIGLGRRGEEVALLARRYDRLVDAAKEAGPGALAIRCDVTDEESCRSAIDEAAAGLGGIDALVYTTGIGPLSRIEDLDAATWRRAFDTNVVGAAMVTAAALPHLQASRGAAAYLSSVSASLTPPWPGLAAYLVSKAALDRMVEAWRTEHPEVGFTRVTVGDCPGGEGESMTQFANDWDSELAIELGPIWMQRNLMNGGFIEVDELVTLVHDVVSHGASVSIPAVAITPRAPAATPPTTSEEVQP